MQHKYNILIFFLPHKCFVHVPHNTHNTNESNLLTYIHTHMYIHLRICIQKDIYMYTEAFV